MSKRDESELWFVAAIWLFVGTFVTGGLFWQNFPSGTARNIAICDYLEAERKDNLCVKDGKVVYTYEDK